MWRQTQDTWQVIKLNMKNVLFFELAYRAITGPLYLAIIDRGLKFSLKMAGYSYLTASNIGSFLIKPWTIPTLAVVVIVGLLLLTVEMGGLITAYQGAAYYRRLHPVEILTGGIVKLADEFRRKNVRLPAMILIHYFLMNIYLIYRTLTHVKPLNFVMMELLGMPGGRLAVAATVAVCIFAAVPALFVYHGCMVEQKSFSDSLRRSRELLRDRYPRTVIALTAYNLVLTLGLILLYKLAICISAVCVVIFTDKRLASAVLLAASSRIEMVILFAGSIAVVVVNLAAITVQFFQYASKVRYERSWNFSYPSVGRKKKKTVFSAVCLIAAISFLYIFDTVKNGSAIAEDVLAPIPITAHRGSSRSAPENTMAALNAAVEELSDYAEIDVQMTLDGYLVLFHDNTLNRVAGIDKSVASMTFEEVKQADVGKWFSEEFAGERIPTLEEAMDFSKGKIGLNIEIKYSGKDSSLPERVLELIELHDMEEQCVVTSTSLSYLKRIKEASPDVRTGYIVSAAYGDYYSNEAMDFISIRSSFVNDRLVEAAHLEGKEIHVWTVNSKSEMERMKLLGVDNVITDYPVLAREILYRESATESLLEFLKLALR